MNQQCHVMEFLKTFSELTNAKLYYYIYRLIDPRTGQVCYLGRTLRPTSRLQEHLLEAKKSVHKTNKHRWFCELIELGLLPRIEFLEICEPPQAEDREQYWIDYYRKAGQPIFNMNTARKATQGYSRKQEILGFRANYKTPPPYTAQQAHNRVFQSVTSSLET